MAKKWEMTPKQIAQKAAEKEFQKPNVVSNTEEVRIPEENIPRLKREERAILELELSKLGCRYCNSIGNWKIVKTMETLRYVKCGVCSRTSAIPSKGPITRTLRPSDLKDLEKKQS